MSRAVKRDIPASVRARLLKMASPQMSFNRILDRHGIERLIYRLQHAPHARRFTLKGAQLFLVWTGK